MKKFEYKILNDSDFYGYSEILSELGSNGWELTAIKTTSDIGSLLFFKRELPTSADDLAKELQK